MSNEDDVSHLLASAHALASTISVASELGSDEFGPNGVATAAAIAAISMPMSDVSVESTTAVHESIADPSQNESPCSSRSVSDAHLLGFVEFVARGDVGVRNTLLEMFPSHDELVAHAHLKSESVRKEAIAMLPSFSYRNRFTVVLEYVEGGGTWRDGLALSDMTTVEAATGSTHRLCSSGCSGCAGHGDMTASSQSGGSTQRESSIRTQSRIDGGLDWSTLDGALDGFKVQLDRPNLTYAQGAREDILKQLEAKIGAQLNKAGKPKNRQVKGGHNQGGGMQEVYFLLRCKGYSDHKCKFQLEVSTTLEDEPETTVKIRHAHHNSCKEGYDYSVKRGGLTAQQKKYCKELFGRGSSPHDVHRSIVNKSDPSINLRFSDGSWPSQEQIAMYNANYHRVHVSELKR